MSSFSYYALMSVLTFSPLAAAAVGGSAGGESAADKAKDKAMPLVKIVERLEKEGYGPISEISKEHGNWEVEAIKGKNSYELNVDSTSGKVLSQHRDDADRQPPKDALTLSKLLAKLTKKSGYSDFDEISFERRYWEIEVFKDGQERELHVDPLTAKVVADRIDD